MKKFLKIAFQVLAALSFIFLLVVSQIQLGYAETEREKALAMEKNAFENAKRAELQATLAQMNAAEAELQKTVAEQLKAELEQCKSGKK